MTESVIKGVLAWVGGAFMYLLGGFDLLLEGMLMLMVIDYILGITIAGVFNLSPKSCDGGLNSNVGFLGLFKKVAGILFVVVSVEMQKVTGIPGVREGVILAITINELVSIIEHAVVMNLPVPKVLTDMVDVLRVKEEEFEEGNKRD